MLALSTRWFGESSNHLGLQQICSWIYTYSYGFLRINSSLVRKIEHNVCFRFCQSAHGTRYKNESHTVMEILGNLE